MLVVLVLAATICGLLAAVAGCTAPAISARELAARHALEPLLLQGVGFQHHAFAGRGGGELLRGDADLLVVFIEGDGSPWIHGGRQIAVDPTPHVPLALQLAVTTPAPVLYLGRPCYLEVQQPPECSDRLWTSERYSAQVLSSMSAAATQYIAEHGFKRVLLVGYSGGATLAVLMAATLPQVTGVISVAGNLDPDTWTSIHGYLPLQGSLNPSLLPPLPDKVRQWYLVGGRDSNVPPAASARYLERVPPERIWSYPDFDHHCCWARDWPAIFARVRADLDSKPMLGPGRGPAQR
jgi:pimeloyl-ACP methyl ester carboxylesterase